jgi:hypothetical protein
VIRGKDFSRLSGRVTGRKSESKNEPRNKRSDSQVIRYFLKRTKGLSADAK